MSDGLVKRLREYAQVSHMAAAWGFAGEGFVMEKAADLIEELELEVETWKSRAVHQNEVAGRLEDKLERAVEALEWVKFGGGPTGESYYLNAVDTLKELKGETNV